jgi:hypothetical protein
MIKSWSNKTSLLMEAAQLHPAFWEYGLRYTEIIYNATPNRVLPGYASPNAVCGIKMPRGLHPFGAPALIHKGKNDRSHALGPTAAQAIFLGLTRGGAKIALDLSTQKIVHVHHLVALDWTAHLRKDRIQRALDGQDMTAISAGQQKGYEHHGDSGGRPRDAKNGDSNAEHKSNTLVSDPDQNGRVTLPVRPRVDTAPRGRGHSGYRFDKTTGKFISTQTGARHPAPTFEERFQRRPEHDGSNEGEAKMEININMSNTKCKDDTIGPEANAKSLASGEIDSQKVDSQKAKVISVPGGTSPNSILLPVDFNMYALDDAQLKAMAHDIQAGRVRDNVVWAWGEENRDDEDGGEEFVHALATSGITNNLFHATGKKKHEMKLPVNLADAMSGSDRVIWEAAAKRHMQKHIDYGCFEFDKRAVATAREAGAVVVPLVTVFDYKTDKKGFITAAKVRTCAAGNVEVRIMKARGLANLMPLAAASVATDLAHNILLAVAIKHGMVPFEYDCTNAYPQAREESPRLLRFPPQMIKILRELGMPVPKGMNVAVVRRNLFGYTSGAAAWGQLLRAVLWRNGFEPHPMDQNVWRLLSVKDLGKPHPGTPPHFTAVADTHYLTPDFDNETHMHAIQHGCDALTLTHSDDSRNAARTEQIMRKVMDVLEYFLTIVNGARLLFNSLGLHFEKRGDGYDLSMMAKIDELAELVLNGEEFHPVTKPYYGTAELIATAPDPKEVHALERRFPFRGAMGLTLWIAIKLRWDILFYIIRLSTMQSNPNAECYNQMIHLTKFLHTTRDFVRRMDPYEPVENLRSEGHSLQFYADTGNGGCPVSGKTFGCHMGTLHGMVIYYQVKRLHTVSNVTAELELMEMNKAAKTAIVANRLLLFMDPRELAADKRKGSGFWNGPVPVHEDNEAAKRNAVPEAPITKKLLHMERRHFQVKQFVAEGKIKIIKIDGTKNPADIGTKPILMHGTNYNRLMASRLGIVRTVREE